MAYRSSSTANGTSTSVAVAVPSGVAANDIILLYITLDAAGAETFTWPTGFTQLQNVLITTPDGESAALAWKRTSGADSGTYTVTMASGGTTILQAIAFSGRDTGNPPVSSNNSSQASNASPATVSASTLTALAGDDLAWISAPDTTPAAGTASHTAPTGYTLRQDVLNGFDNLAGATKDNVSAGATGTVSGTFTFTTATGAGWIAFLVRIPAAAAASGAITLQPISGVASVANLLVQSPAIIQPGAVNGIATIANLLVQSPAKLQLGAISGIASVGNLLVSSPAILTPAAVNGVASVGNVSITTTAVLTGISASGVASVANMGITTTAILTGVTSSGAATVANLTVSSPVTVAPNPINGVASVANVTITTGAVVPDSGSLIIKLAGGS